MHQLDPARIDAAPRPRVLSRQTRLERPNVPTAEPIPAPRLLWWALAGGVSWLVPLAVIRLAMEIGGSR